MKKENINVVLCPPCGENVALATKRGANKVNPILPLLPRLTAVLPPQGREITARGFTLIELLVVVLIIGILAAVALPQYQLAVLKSRFVKLLNISRTYQRAAREHILSTGKWPVSFEDLSVDAPGGMQRSTPTSSSCVMNDEFYCCMQATRPNYQNSGITCGLSDYSLGYFYDYQDSNGVLIVNRHFCVAKQTNNTANKLCSAYNAVKESSQLRAPQGFKNDYYSYRMDIK